MNIFNYFKQLFNKNHIKMEKKIALLAVLFTAADYYDQFKEPDMPRITKIASGIDKLIDELIAGSGLAVKETEKPEVKKEIPKVENKSNLVDPKTPGANVHKEAVKPASPAAKTEPVKPAEKPAEEVNEDLIEVTPFVACEVLAKGRNHPKRVSGNAPRTFKAFITKEAATAANNAYPTVDDLEDVFDEAWKMACEGKSNKEVKEFCQELIGSYYPELKADSDWYNKLVNPLSAMTQFIKSAFGYKSNDPTVLVTRPTEKGTILQADSDCIVKKAEEEKKAIALPAAAAKAPEVKKDLKTTQTAKADVKKVEVKDEEAQEKEDATEEVEELELDLGEEAPERDTTVPPAVSEFADFNDFEKLVFDKIMDGGKVAAKATDEASKKAIQAENREEVRNLISSNFEDEEWTVKGDDGKWNPKLIKYHNDIITEIQKNRANWPK